MAPILDGVANAILRQLSTVAGQLAGLGVTNTGDMAGQMFGRLITDRKFLATPSIRCLPLRLCWLNLQFNASTSTTAMLTR